MTSIERDNEITASDKSSDDARAITPNAETPAMKRAFQLNNPLAVTYFPTPLQVQYRERYDVSLPCSGWERVGPSCSYHQKKDIVVAMLARYPFFREEAGGSPDCSSATKSYYDNRRNNANQANAW